MKRSREDLATAIVQALVVAAGLVLPFFVARKRPTPAEGPPAEPREPARS